MKTADDTFKMLKGFTFKEMSDILRNEYHEQLTITTWLWYCIAYAERAPVSEMHVLEKRNSILRQHGWTEDRYRRCVYGFLDTYTSPIS